MCWYAPNLTQNTTRAVGDYTCALVRWLLFSIFANNRLPRGRSEVDGAVQPVLEHEREKTDQLLLPLGFPLLALPLPRTGRPSTAAGRGRRREGVAAQQRRSEQLERGGARVGEGGGRGGGAMGGGARAGAGGWRAGRWRVAGV
jgi:hypothetical protein